MRALSTTPLAGDKLGAALRSSDGVWEVTYAPHIRTLSEPVGVRARPLRYTLAGNGTTIRSDVLLTSASYGAAWLCAEGRPELSSDGSAIYVLFDSFWWRAGDAAAPPPNPLARGSGSASLFDAAVNAVGRAAFVASLSRFPVLYVDEQLALFRFPPLAATIAAVKVASAS